MYKYTHARTQQRNSTWWPNCGQEWLWYSYHHDNNGVNCVIIKITACVNCAWAQHAMQRAGSFFPGLDEILKANSSTVRVESSKCDMFCQRVISMWLDMKWILMRTAVLITTGQVRQPHSNRPDIIDKCFKHWSNVRIKFSYTWTRAYNISSCQRDKAIR
jgi:hypothetical protein